MKDYHNDVKHKAMNHRYADRVDMLLDELIPFAYHEPETFRIPVDYKTPATTSTHYSARAQP